MTTPRRQLIVNADDFGLTTSINAGILGAHQRGLVRSASLLVTTPGFADAIALAQQFPTLDLGLHLALTSLPPVLDPAQIRSLVTPAGRFLPLMVWQRRVLSGQIASSEVRAELFAQAARAQATGLTFTHIDGHHHCHLFGPVATVVAEIAAAYQIPYIRRVPTPRLLPPLAAGAESLVAGVGATLKQGWLSLADARWGGAFAHNRRPTAFFGFAFPSSLAAWQMLVAALPAGVSELMCHPGLADPTVEMLDSYIDEREAELRWLCQPEVQATISRAGVHLTSFRDLSGQG